MSTTEDTSSIDEKKAEESGTSTTSPDFKGFVSNYLSSIIFTIGISIFIIGGLGLYTTKVAQSNILPDNIELAPYTIFDRVVKDTTIDMNVMRPSFFSDNKETLSQKAIFNSKEYLDSFNKSFLCSLKNSADPNAGLFANAPLYFSFVYDNLVAKNFLAINTIFFYLSYLPESLIMLLYGLFGIFLWMGLYVFNVCISIFYHIINIPQLFRTVSEQNDKQWESIESISFIRFMKFILFFFLWMPVGALSAFIMPAFFTLYGLISPLFSNYDIKNGKNGNNVGNFLYDTLVYKKFLFFILATLSLFTNGIKYLGTNSIIGIIVAVIFAYFMGLYTNEMPDSGVDGFSFKIKQNLKQASVADIDLDNPKLVEICQRIPIDDEKMEKIIQRGQRRTLTKPKEVGGNVDDVEEQENIPLATVVPEPSAPPISQKIMEPNAPLNSQKNIEPSAPTISQLNSETGSQQNSPPAPRLETLQNDLNKLESQLSNSMKNIDSTQDSYRHYALEAKLKPQIDELKEEIQKLTQGQPQSGGRKQKHPNYNKKYNIRWT
jgi:hypothetical protein